MITPFEKNLLQAASYDLQVGAECEIEGEFKILTPDQPVIQIASGAFAILTTLEVLKLPKNLVGRTGLLSKYALLGLHSTMGPQVDPGFEGLLTIPVVNMGNSPMTLRLGDPFLTIEFSELDHTVSKGYSEIHGLVEKIRRETTIGVKARLDFQFLSTVEQQIKDLYAKIGNLDAKVNEMRRTTDNLLYATLVAILGGSVAGLVVVVLQSIS